MGSGLSVFRGPFVDWRVVLAQMLDPPSPLYVGDVPCLLQVEGVVESLNMCIFSWSSLFLGIFLYCAGSL